MSRDFILLITLGVVGKFAILVTKGVHRVEPCSGRLSETRPGTETMLEYRINEILVGGSIRSLFWGKIETWVYGGKTHKQLAPNSDNRA